MSPPAHTLAQQALAELLGSAGLVTAVVGAYITAAYWWSSSPCPSTR